MREHIESWDRYGRQDQGIVAEYLLLSSQLALHTFRNEGFLLIVRFRFPKV